MVKQPNDHVVKNSGVSTYRWTPHGRTPAWVRTPWIPMDWRLYPLCLCSLLIS